MHFYLEDVKITNKRGFIMIKCDFCTASSPEGRCNWETQTMREEDCRKAIKRMSKAISSGRVLVGKRRKGKCR